MLFRLFGTARGKRSQDRRSLERRRSDAIGGGVSPSPRSAENPAHITRWDIATHQHDSVPFKINGKGYLLDKYPLSTTGIVRQLCPYVHDWCELKCEEISLLKARRSWCSQPHGLPFAFSPSSTSLRIASERPGVSSCLAAQPSTAEDKATGRRTADTGSTPPTFFGRPLDFLFTGIDRFIFLVYKIIRPMGSANFHTGPNRNPIHGRSRMAKANAIRIPSCLPNPFMDLSAGKPAVTALQIDRQRANSRRAAYAAMRGRPVLTVVPTDAWVEAPRTWQEASGVFPFCDAA